MVRRALALTLVARWERSPSRKVTRRRSWPPRARREPDAGQIQRIGGGHGHALAGSGFVAHGAQRFDGDRQGKLLAQEIADEAAAANFAAIFQAAQRDRALRARAAGCFRASRTSRKTTP